MDTKEKNCVARSLQSPMERLVLRITISKNHWILRHPPQNDAPHNVILNAVKDPETFLCTGFFGIRLRMTLLITSS